MNGRVALAAVIVALAMLPAHAQEADKPEGWVCGGPWGGLVFSLETDPSRPDLVLAMAPGGFFVNEGPRWRRVGRPGAPSSELVQLSGGRFWCASEGELHSSADGADWRPEGTLGDPSAHLFDVLASDPAGAVFAAGAIPIGERSARIFISKRTKGIWSEVGLTTIAYPYPAYLGSGFSVLTSHPAKPEELRYFVQLTPFTGHPARSYAFASSDGGTTWTVHEIRRALNAVVWDPADPSVLFAVELDWQVEKSLLLRSDDGGKSFRPIGEDPRLAKLRTLTLDPEGKGLLLGSRRRGILRCDRDGANIIETGAGLPKAHVSALAVDPDQPKTVFAGTQVGMWRSDNGGDSFVRASMGLAGIQSVGLVDLADGRLGCFGYHEGLRTSADGGRTWQPRPSRMAHRTNWTMALGHAVLVASRPHGRVLDRVTFDGGRTWKPIRVEGEPIGIGSREVYARGLNDRLLVSRDGTRWETLAGSVPEVCCVSRPQPDGPILLIAGDEEGVIYLDGKTAERIAAVPLPENMTAWPFFMPDPLLEDVVYLFGRDGTVCRLDVSARKLAAVCRRDGAVYGGLTADPARPDRRYLAFGDGHFVVSDDAGRTWRPLKQVPRFHEVRALAVSAGRLVVAADGAVHSIALTEIP